MYRGVPKATSVAAIGLIASTVTFESVAAVQLKGAARFEDADDWDQDMGEDNTLVETKKQLDLVEQQLNQMKAESEVNLEIAEAETLEKKHKNKHRKNKKSKKNHLKAVPH